MFVVGQLCVVLNISGTPVDAGLGSAQAEVFALSLSKCKVLIRMISFTFSFPFILHELERI